MNVTLGLIAALIIAVGFAYYQYKKRQSAEALNDNLETKEKVNDIQKDIDKNDALINAEKEKREELERKAEEEKNKDVSKDDLLDFFNKDNK